MLTALPAAIIMCVRLKKKDFVKKADLLLAGQELPAFMLITINCLEYSKVIATGQFRKAAFDGVGNITDGRCTFDE